VILINLLPHREEARKRRKQAFFAGLGVAAVVGALAAGLWYTVLEQMISGQQARNSFLQGEISKLDAQIKDIATLKAEIEALKARQKAVEDLQTDRNIPVYLLNELAKQTPEGIYLTSIKQADQVISINGIAQSNERVSELLRNTLYNSPWLEKPELVEIRAATTRDARDPRRVFDFSMKVYIKRPQAAAVASPASAPKSAPKKS
jgi:type IV pilus assembly protein PilN